MELLQHTLEFQNWGLNAIIIGAAATILFDIVESITVIGQMNAIKKQDSTLALSFVWYTGFGFFLVASGVYGWHIGSIALIVEGLLGLFFYLPLVHLLWKHGTPTRNERIFFLIALLMPVAAFALPGKDEQIALPFFEGIIATRFDILIVVLAASVASLLIDQLVKVCLHGRGVVQLPLQIVYWINMAFWVLYGFAIQSVAYMIIAPFALFIVTLTILAWLSKPAVVLVEEREG